MEYLPLILLAALFWFLILRPQRRRNMQQNALWSSLAEGQEVVTSGGLFGRVRTVEEDVVHLEIAPDAVVRVDRRAIARRVEPTAVLEDRR